MTNKIEAIAYARFSSENQREASIEQQFEIIEKHADKYNVKIVAKFSDSAVSGTSLKGRDGLKAMIKYAEEHPEIRFLICHKIDRLSRDTCDYGVIKKQLKRYGVDIIFVTDNIRTDDDYSIIYEAIASGMAEIYSKNLSKEVMRGMRYNAERCISTGGTPPLGFNVDSKTRKLVVNEDEAEIVSLIFERYGEDECSYQDIVNELNSLGYKTKSGNDFKKSSIYEILRNEKYVGIYTYNKKASKDIDGRRNNHKCKNENDVIRIVDGCPQIISQELWDKVQARINDSKHVSYSTKHYYLLKDKVYCGECGEKMGGNYKPSGTNKKRYTTYDCTGRRRKTGCKNKGITAQHLDKFVLKQLKGMFLSENCIDKLTEQVNQYLMENSSDLKMLLKKEKRRLERKIKQERNIVNSIADGISVDVFKDKLNALTKEKEEVKRTIAILKKKLHEQHVRKSEVRGAIKYFFDFMKEDNIFARRIIKTYVDYVEVFDDRVEVVLNTYRNIKTKK